MMARSHLSRRDLLAAALATVPASRLWAQPTPSPTFGPICLFTKPFQSLSYDDLAEKVRAMGFDGIEATIRKGGHIEPESVEIELPKMVDALKRRALSITVLASSISGADEPFTEKVLRTARGLGITRYRMAHLHYNLNQPVEPQIQAFKPRFAELASLNAEIGIQGLYQNHAGTKYVGASVWDLMMLIRDLNPAHLAAAYDIRHATAEGGTTWPISLSVIQPYLGAAFVKDFRWEGKKLVNVPLGTGVIDPKFFSRLKQSGFHGPISLHEEYIDHKNPKNIPAHLDAIAKDLQTLRAMMANA